MLQKSTYVIALMLIIIIGTSAVMNNSPLPPTGYTGVPGEFGTCANSGCHGTGNPNTGTGSIAATGLPTTYTPNTLYRFSLTITNGTTRPRWGFSIAARNASGVNVGTFSTTNDTAQVNLTGLFPGELSHKSAPLVLPAQTSYTYTALEWTSPVSGTGPLTFYFVGNAANGDGSTPGDFIYTGTLVSTESVLPITLYAFNAVIKNNNVLLSWQTSQEINSNYFIIEKSLDNKSFSDIGRIEASGNSSLSRTYSFTDNDPSYFEKPIYYRLAMVDKDGKKAYSKISNVLLKATATFIKGIYPNPLKAGNVLHVNFVSKESQLLLVKLIDNTGRLVKNTEISADKGSNILDIDIPGIAAGNYKLIIKSDGGTFQQSLLIR